MRKAAAASYSEWSITRFYVWCSRLCSRKLQIHLAMLPLTQQLQRAPVMYLLKIRFLQRVFLDSSIKGLFFLESQLFRHDFQLVCLYWMQHMACQIQAVLQWEVFLCNQKLLLFWNTLYDNAVFRGELCAIPFTKSSGTINIDFFLFSSCCNISVLIAKYDAPCSV